MREACVVSAKNTETATINPTPALPHRGRGLFYWKFGLLFSPLTTVNHSWCSAGTITPNTADLPPPPVGEGGGGVSRGSLATE